MSSERALRQAWLTEIQAIAIYRAEIALLKRAAWTTERKSTLLLCREIFVEELAHQAWIKDALVINRDIRLIVYAHRLAGYFVGFGLALCPAKLSWRLHQWAEVQAARVYIDTAKQVTSPTLLRQLMDAAKQETEHSKRFSNLLQGSPAKEVP